jgi:hypothetical protein
MLAAMVVQEVRFKTPVVVAVGLMQQEPVRLVMVLLAALVGLEVRQAYLEVR